jgi:hypothetical protein
MPLRAAVNISGRPECSLSGTLPLPLFDQQKDDALFPPDEADSSHPSKPETMTTSCISRNSGLGKNALKRFSSFFKEDHEIQTDKAQKSFQPDR